MDWFPVALGAAISGWAGRTLWQVWRARRWLAAPGQVVAVEFPERRSSKGRRIPTFGVRYRYAAAGGATFEGRRVGFGLQHTGTNLSLAGPGGAVAPIRPGAPVARWHGTRAVPVSDRSE